MRDENILATVRIPEADYRITADGLVEKTTDGDTWGRVGPVTGSLYHAIATIQERSHCYARLWRYSREDVSTAWGWMQGANDLEAHPVPIIMQIANDISQAAWEKGVLDKATANV